MTSRRALLKQSSIALFGAGVAPGWLARAASATDGPNRRRKVLVAIFQRGAADGLNIVVPYTDPNYYRLRPSLAIPKASVLDLDGAFGLHPALEPLQAIWREKKLAIVHASGSRAATRSHFDAQDYMESGTPGLKSTRDGWLNRALVTKSDSPVRAIAMGGQMPRTLRGPNAAIAVSSLADFQVKDQAQSATFEGMYGAAGKDTFDAVRTLQSIQRQPYVPAAGADYPSGKLGQNLQQIARMIKANVGLEVAFADMGGWDTHVNQTPQLDNLLTEFGASLAAFYRDLGTHMEDVIVVTMSEFGRTARENGNRGTDHGTANAMFILGGNIQGGKIFGNWPGLEPEQLHEGRDLAVTTDFRDVLGELVSKHLQTRNLSTVFPGHKSAGFHGILS